MTLEKRKLTDLEWKLANGSCGLNTGDKAIYAAYVNGVALFDVGSFVIVTGHCSVSTRESAIQYALDNGVKEADRRYSRKRFEDVLADHKRLER